MKRKRYRVVDKKKFVSFIVITLIMTIAIIFMLTNNQKAYSSTYRVDYTIVKVKKGDTLWKIAIDNMPENYDIRKMVFEIKEFNQMVDVNIYPGDLIKIPIKHTTPK
ncbi:LysM peptidoglycan-binding domain-containing protein [Schnuerera sp.]|uniref:LysM peptidoglycan-binding domain-containing protein n=1 Tax=Schnuerera sp. TaxID=2794844 RepID=UPI002B9A20E5|nr:LysM peptidoglycan-binding domain-containing protein [Schnuerera sp.]HSH34885.1 LysM peptidoglycan-binding domain-containing protein [Schnuerera sp.]